MLAKRILPLQRPQVDELSPRTWHTALFAELGLDALLPSLPSLVPGGSMLGLLSNEVSEQLKLMAGLPIYLGPGDAGSTTLGAVVENLGKRTPIVEPVAGWD